MKTETAILGIDVLAYACGMAGQFNGSKHGPRVIREACSRNLDLASRLNWVFEVGDNRGFADGTPEQILADVGRLSKPLAAQAHKVASEQRFPLLLGGDHSAAAGFWSGISTAHRRRGAIGLIWIDAHMDSHTPQTSPYGYVHGMPLAALLGYGDSCLTELRDAEPKLRPQSICLLGTRDYEPEEKVLLDRLGVRVIAATEVKSRGLNAVIDEALALVSQDTCGFGLSFDLDALDPQDAPGVSTPASGGLKAAEVIPAVARLLADDRLLGLEISEFNPSRDVEGKTLGLVTACLRTLVAAQDERVC